MRINIRTISFIGITAALSYVIAKMTVFPIFSAAPYLKMHFGEVPLLLIMLIGPWQMGILSLFIKEILSFIISGSNLFSLASDFILVAAFLVTAKLVLGMFKKADITSAGIAVLAGAVVRTVLAIPVNFIILYLEYQSSPAAVVAQLPYILAFNMVKSVLGGLVVAIIYKRLRKVLSPYLMEAAAAK